MVMMCFEVYTEYQKFVAQGGEGTSREPKKDGWGWRETEMEREKGERAESRGGHMMQDIHSLTFMWESVHWKRAIGDVLILQIYEMTDAVVAVRERGQDVPEQIAMTQTLEVTAEVGTAC